MAEENPFMTDFCGMTRQLWHIYLFHRTPEDFTRLYPLIDPACVVIGTGKHEFYTSGERLLQALNEECSQAEQIEFVLMDEWYQDCPLGPDTHLVSGGFHVRDGQDDAGVDMDVRFSVVYARREDAWKIVHIHQSVPYREQAYGEIYPKNLSEKIRETQRLAARMTELANTDPVTGLYNHRAFFEQCEARLNQGPLYLMVLDLDDFKQVNDTFGHLAGDEVLKQVGRLLHEATRRVDVLGRVGGDEFAVLCPGVTSDDIAVRIAQRIIGKVNESAGATIGRPVHISIGISPKQPDDTVRALFQRADEALYAAKHKGKNACCVYAPTL